jgi:hypothetical protein
MKRLVGLLMTVFFSSVLLYAQQSSKATQSQTGKGTEMTGWICSSKCVTHTAGTAACDQTCNDKSGDVVFIDDSGKVTKISNPDMAMDKMGKKVKVHCDMNKEQGTMQLYDVVLSNPPG